MLVYWRVSPDLPGSTSHVSTPNQSLGWTPRQREKSPEDLIGWKFSPFFTRFFEEPKQVCKTKNIYHVDFLGGGGEKFWKMDDFHLVFSFSFAKSLSLQHVFLKPFMFFSICFSGWASG